MKIDEDLRHKIGLALNEATILGVEFEKEKNIVSVSFAVISMDKYGNVPEDNRLLFIFKSIGRFVASFRNGHWDDNNATVEKFDPENILEIIQRFRGQAIYGWDFINIGDDDFNNWKDKLSFDYFREDGQGFTNTIDLFQEGGNIHIDLRIWFDDFEILTPKYEKVELEDFIENGKRGWDAIYGNNTKMDNFGIIPATTENEQKLKTTIENFTSEQKPRNWLTKIIEKLKN